MRYYFILVAVATTWLLSSIVDAQDWARRMFQEFEHNFGSVAKNEVAEHRFVIENVYQKDVRIRAIKSSCTCAAISIDKRVLKSGEQAELLAAFNTRTLVGAKQATITVYFDQPFVGEVQLTVRGTIRGDVMFEPGVIDFGSLTPAMLVSKDHRKQIRITKFNNINWRIIDVKSTFPHIGVSMNSPVLVGNQLQYTMDVRLKETAPIGFLQGELIVVANDFGNLNHVPVKFTGKIESALRISPEVLTISSAESGDVIEKKVVVKADRPFRIVDVTSSNTAFAVSADSQASKKVHFVVVAFTVSQPPGRYEYELEFVTDLDERTTGMMKAIVQIDEAVPAATSTNGQ